MNKSKGMRWWGYVICLIIIVIAIYMATDLIKTFTAKSDSIGFSTEEKFFKTAVDIDKDFNNITLQKNTTTGYYDYFTTFKAVNGYDGTKNKYELLVNNTPCSVNTTGAGYLNSEFRLKFYNINGEVDEDTTLYINFQFFNNKTNIRLVCKNNNAVSYWKSYIENNGLNLKIVYSKL